MTTLVTGATGLIGARVLKIGDRALVRSAGAIHGAVVGDLLDSASLAAACEDIESIFHCAGYAHAFMSADPELHWRINYGGTRNLVTAAGRAGARRFVFLSSVKAMAEPGNECVDEDWPGEPTTPYGRAKRAAEEAVLEAGARYGMHVVNLRLAMVYGRGGRGNLERMARGIQAGWFPRLPDTGNRRSLVHVSDVVSAMKRVADAPEANGQAYIIADPRPYSGREIYDTISSVSRGLTFRWTIPEFLLRAGAKAGDVSGRLLNRPVPLDSEVVDRLLGSACYLPTRIERQLGWRAKIGLAAGVREMLGC